MNHAIAKAIDTFSIVIPIFCIGLDLFLAVVAYDGSRLTGGGAAQGDLGFFMMLKLLTPPIGAALLLSFAAQCFSRWLIRDRFTISRVYAYLVIGASFGLAWNWFFLFKVWRA